MADEFYKTQEIFVKFGHGLRRYPFSLVELVNPSTGAVIGSGMMPDGENVYSNGDVEDMSGDGQIIGSMIEPDFIVRAGLASGVLEGLCQ